MDRNKVIKATELLDDFFDEYRDVYDISPHEAWEIIKDTLKEQEAIEPTIDEYGNKRCGSCGHKRQSIADPDLFCCKCGKQVRW